MVTENQKKLYTTLVKSNPDELFLVLSNVSPDIIMPAFCKYVREYLSIHTGLKMYKKWTMEVIKALHHDK